MRRLPRAVAALVDTAGTSRSHASAVAAAASSEASATTTAFQRLAAAFLAVSAAAATTTSTTTACEPAPTPPPNPPSAAAAVRRAVLSAWEAVDADCHRDEAALLSLSSPLSSLLGGGAAAAAEAAAALLLPPPAAPPAVAVDARTGVVTVSFSVREGADELGVLLSLAELVQALSSSSSSSSASSSSSSLSSDEEKAAPPLSVVPLRSGERGGDRGLRLSAGDAAATFLTSSSAAAGPSPKVELTAPASRLVAVQGGQQQQPQTKQQQGQKQQHSSSSPSSPLEKLFRASNAVVSSFDEEGPGEEGRPRRRSFSRSWTWHSGGGGGIGGGENDKRERTSLRGELAGPLFQSVDEVFRQSLEELFGPLEGARNEGEGGGGGVRLEGRLQTPAPPSSSSPSSPGSPPTPPPPPPPGRRRPSPRPVSVPRGGSARAASAIAALEDLGCSVFLPPRPRPAAAAAAAAAAENEGSAGGGGERAGSGDDDEDDDDPWSGLAAYERQKEEVRLALLPLTHGEVVSGVAEAARRRRRRSGGSEKTGGGKSASSTSTIAAAPRAVLFEGPPGCGKTSSARAAARLAGVPLVVAPLESIVSKWYGEAEQRLAAVFRHSRELAEAATPAAAAEEEEAPARAPRPSPSSAGVLLFIDEVDALATSRGEGGMHEATRRVLGTLLRELDGLRERKKKSGRGGDEEDEEEAPSNATSNLVAVLSTNRPEQIDAALASRCAARVFFPLPDAEGRAAVIGLHARHLTSAQLAALAKDQVSGGLSPRDLVDATAAAERSWAARVVAGKAQPGTAPPFVEYERAVEERAARRW